MLPIWKQSCIWALTLTHHDTFMRTARMDEIPIERMTGEGVVIRLDKSVNEEIVIDDLVAATPAIEQGDIVAIDTGWSARWGTPEWNQHPYLSLGAAQWLIEHRVKLVAVDTATPDLPF